VDDSKPKTYPIPPSPMNEGKRKLREKV